MTTPDIHEALRAAMGHIERSIMRAGAKCGHVYKWHYNVMYVGRGTGDYSLLNIRALMGGKGKR